MQPRIYPKIEMRDEIEKYGLPMHPEVLLRQAFVFKCEHGSHWEYLAGTVTGVSVSDEGGLQLEISNKRFWGAPIEYLTYSKKDGWKLKVDVNVSSFEKRLETLPDDAEEDAQQIVEEMLAARFFKGECSLTREFNL